MRRKWRPVTAACVLAVHTAVPTAAQAAPTIPPSIELDTVTGQYLTNAEAEVGSATAAAAAAARALSQAGAAASAASTTLDRARQARDSLGATQRRVAKDVQTAHDRVRDFAVAAYMTGGPGTPVAALLSSQSIGDFGRRRGFVVSVMKDGTARLRAYQQARDAAVRSTLPVIDADQRASAAKTAADSALAAAAFDSNRSADELARSSALLTLVRGALPAPGTDIPAMVLDAYRRASAAVSARGCPLPWWAVAGIGKVESNHGRSHGTQLGANGDLDPPILGPALDGSNGTQAVPATDGGRLTGDPMWDHAVGPLQFIPSTWRRWGRNGNPNNIYDASLAAATYLCAAVPDVTTDAGLAAAFHAYNHSDGYVAEVLAYAHAYAGR